MKNLLSFTLSILFTLSLLLTTSCTTDQESENQIDLLSKSEKLDLEKAVSNFRETYDIVINSQSKGIEFDDVYFRTKSYTFVLRYDNLQNKYLSDVEYVGSNTEDITTLNKSSYLCSWSDDTTTYTVYSDATGYHVHVQSCIGGQCSDGAVIDYSMIYAHFVCWQNGTDVQDKIADGSPFDIYFWDGDCDYVSYWDSMDNTYSNPVLIGCITDNEGYVYASNLK